jgi:hypothetical protein
MSDQLPQHSISNAVLDDLATFISKNMNVRSMEPFLAKLLIDRWDSLTTEERMTRTLAIPPQCYICGVDSDSFDGDGFVHFSPDPRVGYTKVYCSQCCFQRLLEASDDDNDDDDEGCDDDEFSVGGASQPAPSSSAPLTAPNLLASALVLINSQSSPLMIQSIRRLCLRLRIPMQPPSDTINIGSRVIIEGLQASPELNGRTGVTLAFTEESGRWSVQIDAGMEGPTVQKSIRTANLKVLPPRPPLSAPALYAESERNRLYKHCCECGAPATSFCDSCKVAPYCSSKCQQEHWPRHSAACVAYVKQPENRDAVAITLKLVKKLTEERVFPHDWEHPYSFIFIRPVPDSVTWDQHYHSTIAAVEGIVEANLPLPNHAGRFQRPHSTFVFNGSSPAARTSCADIATKTLLRSEPGCRIPLTLSCHGTRWASSWLT